jgi:hypothetical protein
VNATAGNHEELIKLRLVVREGMGKALNLGRKLCVVAEPKEKYAGVSIAPSKDQLAKVTVVGDEDAALFLRDRKHLFIRYTRWVIAADSSCIVAKIWSRRNVIASGRGTGSFMSDPLALPLYRSMGEF